MFSNPLDVSFPSRFSSTKWRKFRVLLVRPLLCSEMKFPVLNECCQKYWFSYSKWKYLLHLYIEQYVKNLPWRIIWWFTIYKYRTVLAGLFDGHTTIIVNNQKNWWFCILAKTTELEYSYFCTVWIALLLQQQLMKYR